MKNVLLTLIASAALVGCSSNDERSAFAGLPIVTEPTGATVYVGRVEVGRSPVSIPDSAWERAGGRVGNTGLLRVIAPGCDLETVPVDLAKFQSGIDVELDCLGESPFRPSDLGFLESRSVFEVLEGVDRRLDERDLDAIRKDELHVLYAEGRLSDADFRAALDAL